MEDEAILRLAANALREADALLIGAGAGMGVDSGLPDFRGKEGFWRAYPPLQKQGLTFEAMAQPIWFDRFPERAWGFYGHRLNLYRATRPHCGFDLLLQWAQRCPKQYFVYTSNVDGQFQKAGFHPDRIVECHGSIHYLQCCRPCTDDTWAEEVEIEVDPETTCAVSGLPECDECGDILRPNILMFNDGRWISSRTDMQEEMLEAWLDSLGRAYLVIVECGAGTAIQTVRRKMERIAHRHRATLIRINPDAPEGPPGTISLSLGALDALQTLAQR